MEVLFMDTAFKMTRIIDAFSSLIWIDRYIGFGEFELRLPMDDEALVGVRIGYYASIQESDRYMIVEGIEISTSFENGNIVRITGRSLESLLDRRIVSNPMTFMCTLPEAITRLLNENIIDPDNENRKMTRLTSINTDDATILEIEIDLTLDPGEILYNVLYSICDTHKIGFRILPDKNTDGGMVFSLYNGKDRSYSQDKNPYVVFSPNFENIKNTVLVNDTTNLRSTVIGRTVTTIGKDEDEETIEFITGDEYSDMERRELYNKSSIRAENIIDKASFGVAEDMVDKRAFSTYEPIYFDSKAYDEAMTNFNNKLNTLYVPKQQETTVQQWTWYKPGDSGYSQDYANLINVPSTNGYWSSVTIPGDTVEQYKANNARYYSYAANNQPSKDDFTIRAWVLTDVAGYYEAIAEAQAKIDAAYEAALEDERNNVKNNLSSENDTVLSPYLKINEFEGEVDSNVQFKFGESYGLGDIVQIVNEFNYQAVTRVVSMTFTEEEGVGIVNYPGFASDDKAVFDI